MLAFVVAADFLSKPYQLPGLADPDLGTTAFANLVANQQREVLLELLGESLYDAFEAGLTALPPDWDAATDFAINAQVVYGTHIYKSLVNPNQNVIPSSDPASWQDMGFNKWVALKVGDSYVLDKRKYDYIGMKEMLKPFMYIQWLTEQATSVVTMGGVVTSNAENSNNACPGVKIGQAWDDFRVYAGQRFELNNQGDLYRYLYVNGANYFADVQTEGDSDFTGYLNNHWPYDIGDMNEFDI